MDCKKAKIFPHKMGFPHLLILGVLEKNSTTVTISYGFVFKTLILRFCSPYSTKWRTSLLYIISYKRWNTQRSTVNNFKNRELSPTYFNSYKTRGKLCFFLTMKPFIPPFILSFLINEKAAELLNGNQSFSNRKKWIETEEMWIPA